ncbi:hypothetical protein [Streptomyces sp. NPDC017949]|uniref:hypothetical protein n=1 Tax=Streptomyces sp. NPDC017949 TaxID=3365020 RepID=UPI00378E556E
MPAGNISLYNSDKGFGTVTGDDGKIYNFVPSQVERGTALMESQRVTFNVVNGEATGITYNFD